MKKYIAVFFATVALACCLTGCGKDNENKVISENASGEISGEVLENKDVKEETSSIINTNDIKELEVLKEIKVKDGTSKVVYPLENKVVCFSGEYVENGVERKITISFCGEKEEDYITPIYELDIDGAKTEIGLEFDGEFYIVDLDKNDEYVEIVATSGQNESGVVSNTFYRYINGGVVEIGKISNLDGIKMNMYQNKILGMPVYFEEGALVGSYYIVKDNKIENVKVKYEDVKDNVYTITDESIDYILETVETTSNLKNIKIGEKLKLKKFNDDSEDITENDFTTYIRAEIESGDEVIIQNPAVGVSL